MLAFDSLALPPSSARPLGHLTFRRSCTSLADGLLLASMRTMSFQSASWQLKAAKARQEIVRNAQLPDSLRRITMLDCARQPKKQRILYFFQSA